MFFAPVWTASDFAAAACSFDALWPAVCDPEPQPQPPEPACEADWPVRFAFPADEPELAPFCCDEPPLGLLLSAPDPVAFVAPAWPASARAPAICSPATPWPEASAGAPPPWPAL